MLKYRYRKKFELSNENKYSLIALITGHFYMKQVKKEVISKFQIIISWFEEKISSSIQKSVSNEFCENKLKFYLSKFN